MLETASTPPFSPSGGEGARRADEGAIALAASTPLLIPIDTSPNRQNPSSWRISLSRRSRASLPPLERGDRGGLSNSPRSPIASPPCKIPLPPREGPGEGLTIRVSQTSPRLQSPKTENRILTALRPRRPAQISLPAYWRRRRRRVCFCRRATSGGKTGPARVSRPAPTPSRPRSSVRGSPRSC